MTSLTDQDVLADNIFVVECPGIFELPLTTERLIDNVPQLAAVCAIGCSVRTEGVDSSPALYAANYGLMTVQLRRSCPVVNGIIICDDSTQAESKTSGQANLGIGWGYGMLDMSSQEELLSPFMKRDTYTAVGM
eukprot:GHVU01066679.1.p3 GENE.GHVU01066679.1~~GHVU01066679.1.p3  ORF type:complete len:134 (+),score=24.98 GHVU01066679.1:1814-2215(+)